MTPQPCLSGIGRQLVGLVATVIRELRPQLVEAALSGDRSERRNVRHASNFLSAYDLAMHERYRRLLAEILPSFVYVSEEADPEVIGDDPDPDLCVLVDPLDTSEMAVRALCGYTHVLVYSRSLARPIAAVVGDIFHHLQIYVAARDDDGVDRAFVFTQEGASHSLELTRSAPLAEALVTNFFMKPERFTSLAGQTGLVEALGRPSTDGSSRGRIGVDFGSIGLCHVAAGFSDAMVEFAKGFATWDLAPGHYILHAAGGVVLDLGGDAIPMEYGFGTLTDIAKAMANRYKFVAASGLPLAREILTSLRD
ncbi:inositol monophosphatase family protein [Nonomuraea longicatena]|uniref:inositol monophosphatase family protein n=1 Tax=Nonomuraea longicatena TaxID=83682 RepID=UPI0031CE17C0